jgi:hypothetical protein
MKNKKLVLFTACIFLTPLAVTANSDDSQYPAANFQPKVIFLDESVKALEVDSKYPAANFQPTVLYMDESVVTASGASKGDKSVFDPKYPAANFEPKVIYP